AAVTAGAGETGLLVDPIAVATTGMVGMPAGAGSDQPDDTLDATADAVREDLDAGGQPVLARPVAWVADDPAANDDADVEVASPSGDASSHAKGRAETGFLILPDVEPTSDGGAPAGAPPEAPGFAPLDARQDGDRDGPSAVAPAWDPEDAFPASDLAPDDTGYDTHGDEPVVAPDDVISLPAHMPTSDVHVTGDDPDEGDGSEGWEPPRDAPSASGEPPGTGPHGDSPGSVAPDDHVGLAPNEAAIVDDLAADGPAESATDTPDEWSSPRRADDLDDAALPLDQAPDVVSAPAGWDTGDDPGLTNLTGPRADDAPDDDAMTDLPPMTEPADPSQRQNLTGDDLADPAGGEDETGDTGTAGRDPGEPSPGPGTNGRNRPIIPPWRRR
nr:hypothetical protein [Chloroflexia bacterium]